MHIIMAIITPAFCRRKHKRHMTLPAVYNSVLPCQGKSRCIMVERVNLFIQQPSFSTMALLTAYLKSGAVRGLGLLIKEKHQHEKNQE
jgi:hypothetical protein